jgi:glycosyltransferase involved in cell wall biosynthesis
MPEGVVHKKASVTSTIFGVKHILYYFFLILSAFKWRKKTNVAVRIIGVNVPVVPLTKTISRKKFVISYQFDWAYGMKKDYQGIKPLVSSFVQSAVIRSADHLICTTEWLAEIARTRYNKRPEQITIIPNYVNTHVFKPSPIKLKQIAFAGRLHWSKGIGTLIVAFQKFLTTHPEYKLIVMGMGEEGQSLKNLAGSDGSVIFTGGVSNLTVAEYFNESEVFVLPTVNMEGHPKALVEAMAAGCKCIASDVPGNNHVLHESKSADLLFPSGNADRLAEVLTYATRYTLDNQYKYALENYSAKGCFDKELAILTEFPAR